MPHHGISKIIYSIKGGNIMRVFLSGANGCLGSNLARRLVKENYFVHAFVQKGMSHPFLEELKSVKIFEGDILDNDSIIRAMQGCDYVFHVAGLISYAKADRNKLYAVNLKGTKNTLAAAKVCDVKKFIHTSSTASVGIASDQYHPLDEDAEFEECCEKIPYYNSKRLGEYEVKKACHEGLTAVTLCPATFYGVGDIFRNSVYLLKKVSENKIRLAAPGGFSVVSMDDVVEGHMLALEKGRTGERYILSNENLQNIDLLNKIARLTNAKPIQKVVGCGMCQPLTLCATIVENVTATLGKNGSVTKDIVRLAFKHKYYDSSKARNELGWKPKEPIDTAISKSINFYKKYNLWNAQTASNH